MKEIRSSISGLEVARARTGLEIVSIYLLDQHNQPQIFRFVYLTSDGTVLSAAAAAAMGSQWAAIRELDVELDWTLLNEDARTVNLDHDDED